MTAKLLDGKTLATQIRAEVASRSTDLAAAGRPARLAVVTANDDDASAWYVRSIGKAAAKVGITCDVVRLGADATPQIITSALHRLSDDAQINGIIVQTPLPHHAVLADLASAISPDKDVDGANPVSLGRLAAGRTAFAPATAAAVLRLLDHHGIEINGRHAVVVGRSTVVGKPTAALLLNRHATVTICHSRTSDLAAFTRTADILVAAVGRTALLTADHIGPGAVVVDVGTNPTPGGGLAGDVDPAGMEVAGWFSPVPGGVGPVTTALLLQQTVQAAER